ncbi:hypothetical protein Mapa_001210 [Marchantia paleacea]|nr:hypothetical protein Mapa_001210 [Marchantia paleacea]
MPSTPSSRSPLITFLHKLLLSARSVALPKMYMPFLALVRATQIRSLLIGTSPSPDSSRASAWRQENNVALLSLEVDHTADPRNQSLQAICRVNLIIPRLLFSPSASFPFADISKDLTHNLLAALFLKRLMIFKLWVETSDELRERWSHPPLLSQHHVLNSTVHETLEHGNIELVFC